MRAAGENLGSVTGIAAAVPGEQASRSVAGHGVELFAQNFAANAKTFLGIAERGEKRGIESPFRARLVPSPASIPRRSHAHTLPTLIFCYW
jgi:hypothetical protein